MLCGALYAHLDIRVGGSGCTSSRTGSPRRSTCSHGHRGTRCAGQHVPGRRVPPGCRGGADMVTTRLTPSSEATSIESSRLRLFRTHCEVGRAVAVAVQCVSATPASVKIRGSRPGGLGSLVVPRSAGGWEAGSRGGDLGTVYAEVAQHLDRSETGFVAGGRYRHPASPH